VSGPLLDEHRDRTREERPVNALFSLRGRVAVVTGGTGRVGAMIARGLAEAGAAVAVVSRDETRAAHAAAALGEEGHRAGGFAANVESHDSLLALRRRVIDWGGRVDVLVNAARSSLCGTLEDSTAETWDRSMAANARGLFLACQVFAEPMTAQRSGCILNVASVMGVIAPFFPGDGPGRTTTVDYPFVKGGMIALTRYLAAHLAQHGVRVNALSPGGVFSGTQTEEFLQKYCAHVPLRRLAGGEDIKAAAVFLTSDASAYVTGQNLILDGGLSIW
jgi:NAD(P)-dependent dehydrogenase (short-subunit alcohol dehydrogenase family)